MMCFRHEPTLTDDLADDEDEKKPIRNLSLPLLQNKSFTSPKPTEMIVVFDDTVDIEMGLVPIATYGNICVVSRSRRPFAHGTVLSL